MIQDIEPSRLDNAFRPGIPEEKDFVLLFDVDGRILVRTGDGKIRFTTGKEVPADGTVYLFSVDGDRYFCALTPAGTALPPGRFSPPAATRARRRPKRCFSVSRRTAGFFVIVLPMVI